MIGTIFKVATLGWAPYTTQLLVYGILIGVIHAATRYDCSHEFGKHEFRSGLGYMGESIQMWLDIDSHLLLFTFLPALLFGDAIGLTWYLVKQCILQCLVLAIPGVLIGTALTAVFAKYATPYNWDWDACFMFGSILSATDPVAVVGLLKEVGAKGSLTMQIAGESMFNDGVAIVLYSGLLSHVLKEPAMMVEPYKVKNPDIATSGTGGWIQNTSAMVAAGMNISSDGLLEDDGWFIGYIVVLFCKMFFGGVLIGWMFGTATKIFMEANAR